MQKVIFVFTLFFSTMSHANIEHIGKWVLLDEQNTISAMTSSPTGGILNFTCLPADELLLELYSPFEPNDELEPIQVGIDNMYTYWNYQGDGVVSTENGVSILSHLNDKNAITVKLYFNQKPITLYQFDIEGVAEMTRTLKSLCQKNHVVNE